MRKVQIRSLAAALIALVPVAPAFAGNAAPACGGRDLLAELQASAPTTHAHILTEATRTENGGALLWRATKAGQRPSYLFGTIHMTDPRVTTLSPAVAAALDDAATVAVEIAGLSDGAVMQAVGADPRMLLFTDGRRLDQLLSPAEFATVSRTLGRIGVPQPAQAAIRPWLVSMLLAVSDCERARMAEKRPVLDQVIEHRAKTAGKPVIGLETVASQVRAMATVADADQIAMLKSTLRYADRSDDLRETMLQLYLDRRIGAAFALQRHFAAEAGLAPDATRGFERSLISARNLTMHQKALPLVQAGAAFIAVGAAHLTGPDGLVALLRREGYWLTPVE